MAMTAALFFFNINIKIKELYIRIIIFSKRKESAGLKTSLCTDLISWICTSCQSSSGWGKFIPCCDNIKLFPPLNKERKQKSFLRFIRP